MHPPDDEPVVRGERSTDRAVEIIMFALIERAQIRDVAASPTDRRASLRSRLQSAARG
jgi:hypothetical protein